MRNIAGQEKDNRAKLAHSAQHIVLMLTVQFLLGMAVNLIGLPDETGGGAKAATTVFLALHVLIAVGLVIGAIMALNAAKSLSPALRRLTEYATAGISVTFVAGVLTMITDNNWWSYLMAGGFIVTLLMYGSIYVQSRKL
jgi:hypothetical protein